MSSIDHVPASVDEWRQTVEPFAANFYSNLNTAILNVANNVFVEKSAELNDQFEQHVKSAFQVSVAQCDFVGNSAGETDNINEWVASKTNQMIKDLIQPGILTNLTELVLVNAVHFLGQWKDAFDKSRTLPATFYGTDGESECKLMSKTKAKVQYGSEGDYHWVSLPFSDEKYKMTLITVNDKSVKSELDTWVPQRLSQGIDNAFPTKQLTIQSLCLPIFEIGHGMELSDILRTAPFNINIPFTNQADFTHLIKSAKTETVSLDKVIHKAVIKVDEEGVEASAATATSIKAGNKGIRFIADSSFAFVLSDDSNKTLLFVGKVNNL